MPIKETLIVNEKLKICLKNSAYGFLFAILAVGLIAVAVVIGNGILQKSIYTVNIYDDGTLIELRTTSLSVKEALKNAGITVGEYDEISIDENGTMEAGDTNIYINRAKKVNININGDEKEVYTLKDSVGDVLAENDLQVNTYDYINTFSEAPLSYCENSIVYKQALPITLNIDGDQTVVYSTKNTIGEVLEENGIYVNDDDFVNQKPSDTIDLANTEISIVTAHNVTLKYDGKSEKISTQAKTVEELLNERGVKLSRLDKMANGITVNTKIKEGMIISVIRVEEKTVTETVTLSYKTVTQKTSSLLKDFRKVISKGSNGQRVDTYTVVTENGKQVSKTLTKSVVTKRPVDAVTQVGTKTYTTFSSAFKLKHSYSKVLDVSAVAYNLEAMTNRPVTDPNYGITANGSKVRAGIIAVDKSVIPLGTKVYVEIVNGNDYGYAIAADVGVSGYTVDLYLNSKSECINFGRRKAKVYILKDQSVDVFALRGG